MLASGGATNLQSAAPVRSEMIAAVRMDANGQPLTPAAPTGSPSTRALEARATLVAIAARLDG